MSLIYGLVNPDSMEIRYVGKTTYPPEIRLSDHLYDAKNGGKRHISCWIRSLDRPPSVIILEKNPENLEDAEIRWIKYFRELGARLANHTDGGEGLIGFKHSQESRAKISRGHMGLKQTPEHIAKRMANAKGRKTNLGRKQSEEEKNKRAESLRTSPRAAEGRLKAWTPERRALYAKRASEQMKVRWQAINAVKLA